METGSPQQFGARVEVNAAEWLAQKRGGRLVARNYRCKGGEIDLIYEETDAQGRVELVFVEVRARRHGAWVDGIQSVDRRKQRKLMHAIRHFLVGYYGAAARVRLDLLAWNGRAWTHVPNVWLNEN